MGAQVSYQAVITPVDDQPELRELTIIRTVRAGVSGPAEETRLEGPTLAAADAALTQWGYARMSDWGAQDAYNGPWITATLIRVD
jgi:capsid protein